MKRYFIFVMLLIIAQTASAVDTAIVPFRRPGTSLHKIVDPEFEQALAVERAQLEDVARRELAWQQFDQKMHNLYKKVAPAGLLYLKYYEDPAKAALLAIVYLLQML